MSQNNYTNVKCVVEVIGRPFYTVGSTYSSKKISGDNSVTIWVGIPGQGGHNFNKEEFDQHFHTSE